MRHLRRQCTPNLSGEAENKEETMEDSQGLGQGEEGGTAELQSGCSLTDPLPPPPPTERTRSSPCRTMPPMMMAFISNSPHDLLETPTHPAFQTQTCPSSLPTPRCGWYPLVVSNWTCSFTLTTTAKLSCLHTCHLPQLSPHTWPRVILEWASIIRSPRVNEELGFGQLVGQMGEQKTGKAAV